MVSVSAFCLLLLDRVGFRQLEMLFAVLILVEGVCMGINFVHADIPSDMVARGIFIPQVLEQASAGMPCYDTIRPCDVFACVVMSVQRSSCVAPRACLCMCIAAFTKLHNCHSLFLCSSQAPHFHQQLRPWVPWSCRTTYSGSLG